jgi:hypothetical protein
MGAQARATITLRAADSGLLGVPHGSCSRGGTVLLPADDIGGRAEKSALKCLYVATVCRRSIPLSRAGSLDPRRLFMRAVAVGSTTWPIAEFAL